MKLKIGEKKLSCQMKMMSSLQGTVTHTPLKFLLRQVKHKVQDWCYLFLKGACFFCREGATDFHKVWIFRTAQKVRSSAKLLKDSELLAKLTNGGHCTKNEVFHWGFLGFGHIYWKNP